MEPTNPFNIIPEFYRSYEKGWGEPPTGDKLTLRASSSYRSSEESSSSNIDECLNIDYEYQRLHNYIEAVDNYKIRMDSVESIKEKEIISLNIEKLELYIKIIRKGDEYHGLQRMRARSPYKFVYDTTIMKELILIYNLILKNNTCESVEKCNLLLQRAGLEDALKIHIFTIKGVCFLFEGAYSKAIDVYQEAVDLAKKNHNDIELLSCLDGLGFSLIKDNQLVNARDVLLESIKIHQSIGPKFVNYDLDRQITMYEELSRVYCHLEEVLLKQNSNESLEVSDSRRARILVSILQRKSCSSTGERISVDEIKSTANDFSSTFLVYSLVSSSNENPIFTVWVVSPEQEVITLNLDANRVLASLEKIQDFYKQLSPRRIDSVPVPSGRHIVSSGIPAEMRIRPLSQKQLLQKKQFKVSCERGNISSRIPEEMRIHPVSPKQSLQKKQLGMSCKGGNVSSRIPEEMRIDSLHQKQFLPLNQLEVACQANVISSRILEEMRVKPVSARELFFRQIIMDNLGLWYNDLIKPIEKYLPQNETQTVTIIPDGCMAQIPFAALYKHDPESNKGEFFIEKHPISIAPSLNALKLLDIIRSKRGATLTSEALVVGNPLGGEYSLEKAEREAKAVGRLLECCDEDVLLNDRATVSNFKEKASKARWIFAACHGEQGSKPRMERYSVFEGQLSFAPDKKYVDGNLHAKMISRLDLEAELVFLSACHSGTGKLQQEGVIGNVWSFLSAGALSTVATYWQLPDSETTSSMVSRFFGHILGKNGLTQLNKAQALREAMLLGMKLGGRDNFKQWGAFFLSGLIDGPEKGIGVVGSSSES